MDIQLNELTDAQKLRNLMGRVTSLEAENMRLTKVINALHDIVMDQLRFSRENLEAAVKTGKVTVLPVRREDG